MYQMTTGKNYDAEQHAYICKACGHKFVSSTKKCDCPECGSHDKREFQQTTASLTPTKREE